MKKNFWILFVIAFLLTIPQIGLTDFNTKGEPREAIVALTMIDQDNWIMPHNNGGEIAYKPPFMHWCVAAVSTVAGTVNEFTARFPSAFLCILMLLWTYVYYARRRDPDTALLTALVCLTSFEVFRAAHTCRVDMTLTFCIVGAILAFGSWVEKPRRRPIPWLAILMMSLGALTKGPVAVALPCGIAGLYLLLRGENFFRAFFSLLGCALAALILPALWYYAAYLQAGDAFLDLIYDENLGRFLGKMSYKSHDNGVWYYLVMLPAGLMPWTLLFIPDNFRKGYWKKAKAAIAGLPSVRFPLSTDSTTLYSAIAAIFVFVFYCIPESKRGVYILPLYPFLSYFVAVYLMRLWQAKTIRRVMLGLLSVWFIAYFVVLPIMLNKRSDRNMAYHIESIVGDAYLTSFNYPHVPQNQVHFFTINFYLKNRVDVWREAGPKHSEGYLIVGAHESDAFIAAHPDYVFTPVSIPAHRSCDIKQTILLYRFAPAG